MTDKLYRWVKFAERMPLLKDGEKEGACIVLYGSGQCDTWSFDKRGIFHPLNQRQGRKREYGDCDGWQWLEELPQQPEPSEKEVEEVAIADAIFEAARGMNLSCHNVRQLSKAAVAAMRKVGGRERQ